MVRAVIATVQRPDSLGLYCIAGGIGEGLRLCVLLLLRVAAHGLAILGLPARVCHRCGSASHPVQRWPAAQSFQWGLAAWRLGALILDAVWRAVRPPLLREFAADSGVGYVSPFHPGVRYTIYAPFPPVSLGLGEPCVAPPFQAGHGSNAHKESVPLLAAVRTACKSLQQRWREIHGSNKNGKSALSFGIDYACRIDTIQSSGGG